MTTLVLFPSRIKFVNPDGTLTPEAFRALNVLAERSGGIIGDVGVETFSDIVAGGLDNSAINVAYTDVEQPATQDVLMPDVVQPPANGINTTITSASLVGKTITVQDGLITGFA